MQSRDFLQNMFLKNIGRFFHIFSPFEQNRRQKVINRGALRLSGGGALRLCRGSLTFKFNKNSTNL